MKIQPAKADAFIAKPDPAVAALLLYGPDAGLVRERAQAFGRAFVGDLADPFQVADLSGAQIKDDPARLSDEVMAQSLMGGRRVVFVRWSPGVPRLEATLAELFAALDLFAQDREGRAQDNILILEAQELTNKSALRLLFENARGAAAIACYADDPKAVAKLLAEQIRAAGLTIAPDAAAFLRDHLGGDRMMSRNEIEKLILYKHNDPNRAITLDDARAAVGDSGALVLDALIDAAFTGRVADADRQFHRAMTQGESPIMLLRLVQRHAQRLHVMAAKLAAGQPDAQVLAAERLHFSRTDSVQAQMRGWSLPRLEALMIELTQAELDCKSTGTPEETITARVILRIAQAAGARR